VLGFRIQGLRFGRVHLGDFLCLVFIRHVLLPEIMHRKEGRIPRALPLPQQGLRFRVSGFGLRASGFGFRVSGFRFRVSGFGFRVFVRGGYAESVQGARQAREQASANSKEEAGPWS
jgi:hypothetical protein